MKFKADGGRKYEFPLLAVVGLFLALFQATSSQGLQCYDCIFIESMGGNESSATCENSPVDTDLKNATTIISESEDFPGVRQLLTRMGLFKGIPLTAPDASVLVENTPGLYCTLVKLNVEGFGRIVARGAVDAGQDLGAVVCDNTVPKEPFLGQTIKTSSVCICKTDRCNGKDISGGADTFVERSILLFLLSVGLAIVTGASSWSQ